MVVLATIRNCPASTHRSHKTLFVFLENLRQICPSLMKETTSIVVVSHHLLYKILGRISDYKNIGETLALEFSFFFFLFYDAELDKTHVNCKAVGNNPHAKRKWSELLTFHM